MIESGEPFRVVGANMDVTARKLTEEALLEVNRNLEAQAALLQSREELLKIFVRHVPRRDWPSCFPTAFPNRVIPERSSIIREASTKDPRRTASGM